ncbi:hypothetical protein QQS21_006370 [Conoideocrella luteorostrata]|uniref:Methyltransferase domain-containing protein n=1 Tax=Conoideocrella luteorostrata TaxID=1105319 RepID=A0AAJ0CQI1_9HYPO|nr:hypothetical protein QQS21_006370 [Conoideocrella luteorostrata]
MTQYDTISKQYTDVFDSLPYRDIEVANVYAALEPILSPNSHVIEFACGAGFYTDKLLSWGVGSVTGTDISKRMIELARLRLARAPHNDLARFVVSDGTVPCSYSAGGDLEAYDIAFAAWFLNYSATSAELTSMFTSVAINLKPTGVFIGVVPHPTEDFETRAEACAKAPLNRLYPRNDYTGKLESGDGWGLRVYLDDQGTNFMTYHLRPSVYEDAARAAGLKGSFAWRHEILHDDEMWRVKLGLSDEEWTIREKNPHLGILIIWKN